MNKKRWALLAIFALLFFWWIRNPKPPEENHLLEASPTPSPTQTVESSAAPVLIASPSATPSVTPISTETPSERHAQNEHEDKTPLYIIIQRNEICKYVKLTPTRNELARALLMVGGAIYRPYPDRVLGELFYLSGAFEGKIARNIDGDTQATRFYSALAMAGLLNGVVPEKLNLEWSHQSLLYLEQEDPSNAVFPFFHAAVLEKMKSNPHEVEMAIDRALSATEFQMFYDELTTRISERGMINPTAWLAARTITSRFPIPNLEIPKAIMTSALHHNNPDYDAAVYKFGIKLEKPFKDDEKRHRTLTPNLAEAQIGEALLKTAEKGADLPTAVNPPQNDKFESDYHDALASLNGKDSCQPYALERLFFQYKTRFVH